MTGWDDSRRWPAGALADIGPFDRRVIAVGGIVFAVLMALSDRYGFDRDELYFLDCARHLQASYVDQPVLAPLLAWVSLKLFGVSLPGLRVWPALAAWATVLVAGLTAREFGGARRAQLLAAVGTATISTLWSSDHLANTTPYALLAWAGLALVVVRIGRTGDCRWWLAGGVVAGLGVAGDHSEALLAVAVVIGALLSGGRKMIWNPWFAAGAAIMLAFEVPDLWWQAQHQWATIAMTEALNRENGGLANIGPWVLGQLGLTALSLAWVWVIGLWCLWRSGRPLWRALAWAYGLLFVLFAITAGAAAQPPAGHCGPHGGGPAVCPARVPARRPRPDLRRGEPGVHRLAPARPYRRCGMDVPAAEPADQCGDFHSRLCRCRGHQRARPRDGAADRRQAARTASGGGDPVTRTPPPSWPSRPGPLTTPQAMAATSRGFSPASGWLPRCPIRTACTTRNGAATSISAPVLASRGPRYGHGCATTTDNRPPIVSYTPAGIKGLMGKGGTAQVEAARPVRGPLHRGWDLHQPRQSPPRVRHQASLTPADRRSWTNMR
jgi:hypothetical protein